MAYRLYHMALWGIAIIDTYNVRTYVHTLEVYIIYAISHGFDISKVSTSIYTHTWLVHHFNNAKVMDYNNLRHIQ